MLRMLKCIDGEILDSVIDKKQLMFINFKDASKELDAEMRALANQIKKDRYCTQPVRSAYLTS